MSDTAHASANGAAAHDGAADQPLVRAHGLQMHFPITAGLLQRRVGAVRAVDGLDFSIAAGETLGLVGESGCGKSTTGRALLQLYRPTAGRVTFEGRELTGLSNAALRPLRRHMQMIFQDPYASLNSRMTIGAALAEPIRVHHLMNGSRRSVEDEVLRLLDTVGLARHFVNRYPHEFSGGQRQRIGIARALSVQPRFVVCDEPVSALDVSVQAQIINLLEQLQEEFGLTYLFITHDLSVVRHISDRVAVMYLGRIVEIGPNEHVFKRPLHPYTVSLLSAVPIPDPEIEEQRTRIILSGEVPSAAAPPSGCRFRTRCPLAIEQCAAIDPHLRDVGGGHQVACIRVAPTEPGIPPAALALS